MQAFLKEHARLSKRLLNWERTVERATTTNPLSKLLSDLDQELDAYKELGKKYSQQKYVDMVGVLRSLNTKIRNEAGQKMCELESGA